MGLENVDYRVIDAERIDLDAASVDGVLCQSAFMLVADPAAALSETRRVLRPGGRLSMSVWSAPERNPWASIGGRILVERDLLAPPEPGAPGVFSMANEERMRALLGDAGFTDAHTSEVPIRFVFSDIDDYERWVSDLSGSFATVLRGLPEDELEVLKAELRTAFEPHATHQGYELGGVALTAVAS